MFVSDSCVKFILAFCVESEIGLHMMVPAKKNRPRYKMISSQRLHYIGPVLVILASSMPLLRNSMTSFL